MKTFIIILTIFILLFVTFLDIKHQNEDHTLYIERKATQESIAHNELVLASLLKAEAREKEKFLKEQKAIFDEEVKRQKEYKEMVLRNKDLKDYICKLEGIRYKSYKDLGGVNTIGCGLAYTDKLHITEEEHEYMKEKKINQFISEIKSLGIKWESYNKNKQKAIIGAIWQMGKPTFAAQPFIRCLKSIKCSNSSIKYLWGEKGIATYAQYKTVKGKLVKVKSVFSLALRERRKAEAEMFTA